MSITEQIVVIIVSLIIMLTLVTIVKMMAEASVKKSKYWALEAQECRKRKEAELHMMRIEYTRPAEEVATEEVKNEDSNG